MPREAASYCEYLQEEIRRAKEDNEWLRQQIDASRADNQHLAQEALSERRVRQLMGAAPPPVSQAAVPRPAPRPALSTTRQGTTATSRTYRYDRDAVVQHVRSERHSALSNRTHARPLLARSGSAASSASATPQARGTPPTSLPRHGGGGGGAACPPALRGDASALGAPRSGAAAEKYIRLTVRNSSNNSLVRSVCFESSSTVLSVLQQLDPQLAHGVAGATEGSPDSPDAPDILVTFGRASSSSSSAQPHLMPPEQTLLQCAHTSLSDAGLQSGDELTFSNRGGGGGGGVATSACSDPDADLLRCASTSTSPQPRPPPLGRVRLSSMLKVAVKDELSGSYRSMLFDKTLALEEFLLKVNSNVVEEVRTSRGKNTPISIPAAPVPLPTPSTARSPAGISGTMSSPASSYLSHTVKQHMRHSSLESLKAAQQSHIDPTSASTSPKGNGGRGPLSALITVCDRETHRTKDAVIYDNSPPPHPGGTRLCDLDISDGDLLTIAVAGEQSLALHLVSLQLRIGGRSDAGGGGAATTTTSASATPAPRSPPHPSGQGWAAPTGEAGGSAPRLPAASGGGGGGFAAAGRDALAGGEAARQRVPEGQQQPLPHPHPHLHSFPAGVGCGGGGGGEMRGEEGSGGGWGTAQSTPIALPAAAAAGGHGRGGCGSPMGTAESFDQSLLLADATNTSRGDSRSNYSGGSGSPSPAEEAEANPGRGSHPVSRRRGASQALLVTIHPPLHIVEATEAGFYETTPVEVRSSNKSGIAGDWEGDGGLVIRGDARVGGVLEVELFRDDGTVVDDLLLCGKLEWYCVRGEGAEGGGGGGGGDGIYPEERGEAGAGGAQSPVVGCLIESNVQTYIPSLHDLSCTIEAVFVADESDEVYRVATPPIRDIPAVKNAYLQGKSVVSCSLAVHFEVIGGDSQVEISWDVLRPTSGVGVQPGTFRLEESLQCHGSTLLLSKGSEGCVVRCTITPILKKNGSRGDGCEVFLTTPIRTNQPKITSLELVYGDELSPGTAVVAAVQVETLDGAVLKTDVSNLNGSHAPSLRSSGKHLLEHLFGTDSDTTHSGTFGSQDSGSEVSASHRRNPNDGVSQSHQHGPGKVQPPAPPPVTPIISWSIDNVVQEEPSTRYIVKASDIGKRLDCTYQVRVGQDLYSTVATAALFIPMLEERVARFNHPVGFPLCKLEAIIDGAPGSPAAAGDQPCCANDGSAGVLSETNNSNGNCNSNGGVAGRRAPSFYNYSRMLCPTEEALKKSALLGCDVPSSPSPASSHSAGRRRRLGGSGANLSLRSQTEDGTEREDLSDPAAPTPMTGDLHLHPRNSVVVPRADDVGCFIQCMVTGTLHNPCYSFVSLKRSVAADIAASIDTTGIRGFNVLLRPRGRRKRRKGGGGGGGGGGGAAGSGRLGATANLGSESLEASSTEWMRGNAARDSPVNANMTLSNSTTTIVPPPAGAQDAAPPDAVPGVKHHLLLTNKYIKVMQSGDRSVVAKKKWSKGMHISAVNHEAVRRSAVERGFMATLSGRGRDEDASLAGSDDEDSEDEEGDSEAWSCDGAEGTRRFSFTVTLDATTSFTYYVETEAEREDIVLYFRAFHAVGMPAMCSEVFNEKVTPREETRSLRKWELVQTPYELYLAKVLKDLAKDPCTVLPPMSAQAEQVVRGHASISRGWLQAWMVVSCVSRCLHVD